jgi:hypothetical protein
MTLTEAMEDYDLAAARLGWVMACSCQRSAAQDDARQWHVAEVAAANERLAHLRSAAQRPTIVPA